VKFQKDGPKRRRYTRRETGPVSRQRYLDGVSNFSHERQKHSPPAARRFPWGHSWDQTRPCGTGLGLTRSPCVASD
jgi:hypothetical protein